MLNKASVSSLKMRFYIGLSCLVFGATNSLYSQSGGDFVANGSNLAHTQHSQAFFTNPAAIIQKKYSMGMWGNQRLMGTDILHGGINAAMGYKTSSIGISANYAGTGNFNRSQLEGSYGIRMSSNLSLGFAVGMVSYQQAPIGFKRNNATARIGLHSAFADKWTASAVLLNPMYRIQNNFGIPTGAHMAVRYKVNKNTEAGLQAAVVPNTSDVLGLNIVHQFSKKLQAMATLQTGYEPITCGIALHTEKLKISFAAAYHTYFGFAPSFALVWEK